MGSVRADWPRNCGQSPRPLAQPSDEDEEILGLLRANNRAEAIRMRRKKSGDGLRDAVRYVDELAFEALRGASEGGRGRAGGIGVSR